MDKHRCKICNRRFANGKAMGGHMRSHLAKLPLPPKPHLHPQSSSSSLQPKKLLVMQSFRSADRDFSLSDSAVHDRESDTESPKYPCRRRSKRRRKSVVSTVVESESPPEQEQVSSDISETTFSEEDVALCLLMLSRDKYWTVEKVENKNEVDEDESYSVTRNQTKYRCETCKKAFRSYQALGGHRASHHKKIIKDGIFEQGNYVTDKRIFECPFCFKVFESGQALGGHKKVHLSNAANARKSAKFGDHMIDLNLPAPQDDDEVISAVSNAQVFHPNKGY